MDSQISNKIDLTVKTVALASAALYIGGFIVVSLHDADYGFIAFSFVRARLISAGILLAFFAFVAGLEVAKAFGIFGLPPRKSARLDSSTNAEAPKSLFALWFANIGSGTFRFLDNLADLFFRAWFISYFLRILMNDFDSRWRFMALLIFVPLIYLFTRTGLNVAVEMQRIRVNAAIFACLDFGFIVAGTTGLLLLKEWTFVELLGWFFLVAIQATEINEAPRLLDVRWHTFGPSVLGTIGLFAFLFYPRIPSQIGGGKPVEVHFDLSVDSPITKPFDGAGWIIDEVDSGYYIAHSPTDHQAVFIPRQSVSAIQFSRGGVLR